MKPTKANYWITTDEKYLYNGDSLGNFLYEEYLKRTKHKEQFKLIEECLTKSKQHKFDEMQEIFEKNVLLKFRFVKSLNLHDSISPGCFYSKTDLGNELLKLIYDHEFILYKKDYLDTCNIFAYFLLTHSDYKDLAFWYVKSKDIYKLV